MKTSLKFFIIKEEEFILGPGKIALLRLVDQYGSLRKAALEMGMSYRWAWGRIKKAEDAIGVPLLKQNDASKSKAKVLTRDAREIIDWFTRTEAELAAVLKRAEAAQPQSLRKGTPSNAAPVAASSLL